MQILLDRAMMLSQHAAHENMSVESLHGRGGIGSFFDMIENSYELAGDWLVNNPSFVELSYTWANSAYMQL